MKHWSDYLALLISLIALAVSINFSNDANMLSARSVEIASNSAKIAANAALDAKTHNELSLRPVLDFQYKLSTGSADGGYIKLVNLGQGPAIITKISATFKGKSVGTSAKDLAEIGSVLGFIANDLREKQVISQGGKVDILTIKPATFAKGEICRIDKARKEFAEALNIKLEYESLYHVVQTVEFSYKNPNKYPC